LPDDDVGRQYIRADVSSYNNNNKQERSSQAVPSSTTSSSSLPDLPRQDWGVKVGRTFSIYSNLLSLFLSKCKELRLDRNEVVNQVIYKWVQSVSSERNDECPTTSEPDPLTPDDHKYFQDLKKQWQNLTPEAREKNIRYIANHYGSKGQDFLHAVLSRDPVGGE